MRIHRDFLASLPGAKATTVPGMPSDAFVPQPDEQVVEPLTERECQVLELLAMMCSTDEIAMELFVSGNTVKTHVKGIFRKLGVNRRVDAVRVGRGLGLC
jgi:LuxR family maltose regulon positive regulatory protein